MNPARKWDFLCRAAADPEYTTAKNFWEKEIRDKVLAYSSYLKTATQITADGTVTDNLPRKFNATHNNSTPNRQRPSHPGIPAKGYGKRQDPYLNPDPQLSCRQSGRGQVCRDFNEGKVGHRDRFLCPNGRIHLCAICGHPHPQFRHDRPKRKTKGRYKGKGEDKGKN
jgi:hypothetical protein